MGGFVGYFVEEYTALDKNGNIVRVGDTIEVTTVERATVTAISGAGFVRTDKPIAGYDFNSPRMMDRAVKVKPPLPTVPGTIIEYTTTGGSKRTGFINPSGRLICVMSGAAILPSSMTGFTVIYTPE